MKGDILLQSDSLSLNVRQPLVFFYGKDLLSVKYKVEFKMQSEIFKQD
mgnify:CR=1 FL=1